MKLKQYPKEPVKQQDIHGAYQRKWVKISDCGIRWDDPDINIEWPLPVSDLSQRDQNLPYLKNASFL